MICSGVGRGSQRAVAQNERAKRRASVVDQGEVQQRYARDADSARGSDTGCCEAEATQCTLLIAAAARKISKKKCGTQTCSTARCRVLTTKTTTVPTPGGADGMVKLDGFVPNGGLPRWVVRKNLAGLLLLGREAAAARQGCRRSSRAEEQDNVTLRARRMRGEQQSMPNAVAVGASWNAWCRWWSSLRTLDARLGEQWALAGTPRSCPAC